MSRGPVSSPVHEAFEKKHAALQPDARTAHHLPARLGMGPILKDFPREIDGPILGPFLVGFLASLASQKVS